jgi:hypothetical protein
MTAYLINASIQTMIHANSMKEAEEIFEKDHFEDVFTIHSTEKYDNV